MSLLRKLEYRSCEELERENPSLTGTAGKEGMNPESIRKLQHLGATLILSVGQNLGLSIIAVHTAVFSPKQSARLAEVLNSPPAIRMR